MSEEPEEEKKPSKKEAPKQAAKVRVRILENKVKACGLVLGRGAELLIDADKAEALEKLNKAKIIGV